MAYSSIAKDFNRNSIIQAINNFGIYTKQEISKITKLSFPTTSKSVDELVSDKMILTLDDKRGGTGGRKAYEYQLNKEYAYSLCIIIEQNKLKAIVTNMDFENKNFEDLTVNNDVAIQQIQSFIQKQIDRFPKIKSIAIGVPGAVHNGKIFLIDGFKQLQNCELQNIMFDQFKIPTKIINNMNALISGLNSTVLNQKPKENIACIHIGEKGPGCGCLVNGAPISGFCGFQGEIGFGLYDEKQTFREIALKGYQNTQMEDYIGRLAIQIITLINPEKLMIYLSENDSTIDIKRYCQQYLPREVIPQIQYLDSYDTDYITGLKKTGIELLYDNALYT